jgi:UDP-2,4-diacetamido-2,4,6-trideoxy-beta-L-altropyranose hydrolase
VMVTLADNQRGICGLFDRAGAAANAGEVDDGFVERLQTAVTNLMTDTHARIAMANAASALVDGRGAQRVLLSLLGDAKGRDGLRVTLRLADASDEGWLLDLQREPGTRAYARNPAVPRPEEHARWMRRVLSDPNVELMLIEADGVAAGMLRLDRLRGGTQAAHYEVSIAICAVHQHKGIASAALMLARRFKPDAILEAEILPANSASIELFRRAGYTPESETRYRSEPALHSDSKEPCQQTSR